MANLFFVLCFAFQPYFQPFEPLVGADIEGKEQSSVFIPSWLPLNDNPLSLGWRFCSCTGLPSENMIFRRFVQMDS
jgi:hypothetical protein